MMAVSKKDRFEVFKRDNFTCQYCGRSAPDVILHADHIDPKAKGGKDDILNLITSCFDCNAGKSDRTLSDDTVIKKRKQQLDQLQERREQLEMMLEWQKGLLELDKESITKIADLWAELVIGYHLNDKGLETLKRYVRRFGISEVVEGIKIATKQYLEWDEKDDSPNPTHESVEKAWRFIPKICTTRQREKNKPYLKELYYIRGILRNRIALSGDREWQSIKKMEDAMRAGIKIEEMRNLAKEVKNWLEFVDMLNLWIADATENDQ